MNITGVTRKTEYYNSLEKRNDPETIFNRSSPFDCFTDNMDVVGRTFQKLIDLKTNYGADEVDWLGIIYCCCCFFLIAMVHQ